MECARLSQFILIVTHISQMCIKTHFKFGIFNNQIIIVHQQNLYLGEEHSDISAVIPECHICHVLRGQPCLVLKCFIPSATQEGIH